MIFSEIVREANKQGKRVLCVVQKNILIKQTVTHFSRHIKDIAIYNAGMRKKNFGAVTIASIQSLARCEDIPKFDIVIIDEVHRFAINKEKSQIRKILTDEIVIGFTATPFVNKTPIFGKDKFFKRITYQKTAEELVKEKFLTPITYLGEQNDTKIDLSKVKKDAGDFVVSHLSATLLENKDKIHAQIKDAMAKSQKRKKILILCVSIEHANYVHSIIGGSIIHSKVKHREKELAKFKTTGRFLTSVLVASEGFDYPDADCLWMFRPTRSLTLYIQCAGRIMRLSEGKEDALFLDYGGIVDALGSLVAAYEKGINGKTTQESMKICPMCGEYTEMSDITCDCGHHFTKQCQHCLEEVKLGLKICPECECDLTIKRDGLRNLTDRAYTNIKVIFVDHVKIVTHLSKNGNLCHRIDFYEQGLFPSLTQYVLAKDWAERKFTKNKHGRNFKGHVKNIKKIVCRKKDRFNEIIIME